MAEAFLSQLDELLNEYYCTNSTNERKAQIESELVRLKGTDGSWVYCAQLLEYSRSQYSVWWALSALEEYMGKRLSSIDEGELVRLEGFLVQKAQQPEQAQFITLKYCKVFVNLAIRRSQDLNCIGDIVKIVQSKDSKNCSVGVTMLQLLSEEITKPRPDLHPDHHGQLNLRLSQCIASILSLLCEQLEKRRSVEASLGCLAHYLSWAPVTDILKPSLLSTVFMLVREALENGQQEGAGVAGVSCVNEIVGRNQVPGQVQEFIMGLFKETLQLLSQITEQRIELESGFHKKLIEFLALFTGGHFRRVESNPSFPVLDFLALLFKFTVSQNDPQFFIGSVDVCSSWVDFLLLAQGSLSPDGAVPRYGSALASLTRLLLHKVTYESSKDLLDQISREDERPSEWDHFMGKITQLLSKVVELNSLPVSQIILELLDRKVSRLSQITDKEELLDVATALHVTQVTLPSVTGEHLHSRCDTAKNIIQYGVLCFKTASSRIQEPCYDIIGESAVRLLATFAQWASAAGPPGGDILRGVLEAVVPSLTSSPVRVQQCIADLVHTTILLSRSEVLLSCPSTQLLYTITIERSVKDETALSTITKALTLLLVLPWQQTKEQRWEERATHLEGYTGKLFAPLQTVSADSEELVTMLTSLSDMVTCVAHRETKSKQLVCRAILAPARHVLSILPQVRSSPKASERLLSFATVLCDSLRVQLGVQFLQELVRLCLEHFTGGQVQFLELLTTVVREPGNTFRQFVPDIVSLALGPNLRGLEEQISEPYLTLVHSILECGWWYLYPRNPATPPRQAEVLALLQILGSSLVTSDFNRIKQATRILLDVNEKHGVFQKRDGFLVSLRQGYLGAALDLLVAGTVGLVEDDVEELVVQVVRAGDDLDIRSFMESYLGKYLPGDVAGRVAAPVDRANLRDTVRGAVRETRFYLSYQA